VPVILGTQIFRGIEYSAVVHTLESSLHSTWGLYAILLLAVTAISFLYISASGAVSFGELKNNGVQKGELFTHAVIPLAFTFEFAYQLNPLLTRLGDFFPTMGRQFGFDLEFLNFASGPGAAKPWQVLFILLGITVSMSFLKIIIKNHQVEKVDGGKYKRLRYLPILLLGCIYIGMFVVQ